MKNYFKNYRLEIIFLLLISVGVIFFVWFNGNFVIWCVDSLLGESNPIQRLSSLPYLWNTKFSMGIITPTQGMFIHYLFLSFLQYLKISLHFQQAILLFIQFFLTLFGGWYFAYTFISKRKEDYISRIAVSFFYCFNIVTLTWIWWRFLGYIYFYPAFIIFFVLFYNFFNQIEQANWKNIFLRISGMVCLSFLFGPAFNSSITIVLFYSLIPITLILRCFLSLQNLILIKIKKYLLSSLFLSAALILANLFYILPQVILLDNLNINTKHNFVQPLTILKDVSKYTSVLNVFRLQGEHSMYLNLYGDDLYNKNWLDLIKSNLLFLIISFIPLIFSIILLMSKKKEKLYIFFFVFLLLTIIIIKGTSSPFEDLLKPFVLSKYGTVWRHPYDKFVYYLIISYAFFYGSVILLITKKIKYGKIISLITISLVSIVLVYPLWTGKNIMSSQNFLPGVKAIVPEEYKLLNNNNFGNGTWLQLPFGSESGESAYEWGDGVQLNKKSILDDYIKNPVIFSNGDGDVLKGVKKEITNAILNKNTEYFIKLINKLNVGVVFLNKDIDFVFMKDKIPFSSNEEIGNFLEKTHLLKKIENKNFSIYQNPEYDPNSVFILERLYSVDDIKDTVLKYNFVMNEFKKDFYFTVSTSTVRSSFLTGLDGVFENIIFENISSSKLKVVANQLGKNNDLYINFGNNNEIVALYENNKIIFYSQPQNILILNNKKIEDKIENKNILKTIYVVAGKDYYILTDNQLLPLIKNKELSLGNIKQNKNIQILVAGGNIISNPSFENGLWQKKIGDCSRKDDNSIMSMSLDRQNKTAGQYSLQLAATTHIACTSCKISLSDSGEYLLSFDFQSPNAKQAGFYLSFNNKDKTVIKNKLTIFNDNWQSYEQKIIVPERATQADFYFYAYSFDDKTSIINRYDNVKLAKLYKVSDFYLPKNNKFEKIPIELKNGENVFTYQDDRYNYENIMVNPSFEDGFWQDKVGDCRNYDDNPMIAMSLNKNEKSEGEQSLQLEAIRHFACTSINIPVKGGVNYLLSFDFQSPNTNKMSYYTVFNDVGTTKAGEDIEIKDENWHTFTKKIIAPDDATQLSIYVYAKELDGKSNIINRYDNFKLIKIPDLSDDYYLISGPKQELKEPASTTFELLNPTKKLVHIKGATTPFFLAMSQSYHDQWQLQLNNKKIQGFFEKWWPFAKPDRVENEYHYKLNDFLNAWYVDPAALCTESKVESIKYKVESDDKSGCVKNEDGSYDMEMVIEFWSQRWFYLGLLISGTTLIGCLGYLVYYYICRRKDVIPAKVGIQENLR